MSDEESVYAKMYSYPYTEHVAILVPPKFFMHPNLGECVKKLIEATQQLTPQSPTDEEAPTK